MPFSLKERFHRARCVFAAQRKNEPLEKYIIHHDDSTALRVERRTVWGGCEFQSLPWNQVNLAWIYKRDCFAYDQIEMLMMKDKTESFVIHEDMEGWDKLVKALPDYLPGIRKEEEWWGEVVFPAFETNLGLIYRNPNGNQAELDEIIKDFEAESEIPRPKPFWDFLFLGIILLTFPWPLTGLSPTFLEERLYGIPNSLWLFVNVIALSLLWFRIKECWNLYFTKPWICRMFQIIATLCLAIYYIMPFVLLFR